MRHVLHLMQPARPGGRGGDEGGPKGRMKPAGGSRRESPQHASELNRPPVVRDFLIVQMPDARYVGECPSLFAQVLTSPRGWDALRREPGIQRPSDPAWSFLVFGQQ